MSLLGGSGKIDIDTYGRLTNVTLGGSGGGSTVNAVTGITMSYDPSTSVNYGTISANPVEAIQGEMIQVYHEVDVAELSWEDTEAMDRLHSQMKESLAEMLAKRLISLKKIEFTKTVENTHNFNSKRVRFRARVFVTPDDKVRTLRLNGKDST